MIDTPETLQSALDDLTRRVAAFEKAQKAEEEPPVCSEVLLGFLERGYESLGGSDYKKAAAEISYLRAELARLREGLKVREGDVAQDRLHWWYTDVPVNDSQRMAREIQRHRKLVAK